MKSAELVFGLVGAIGTDLEAVQESLVQHLKSVGYDSVIIRLSDVLRKMLESSPGSNFPQRSDSEYYKLAMDAGNEFRCKLGRANALAALAIAEIASRRTKDREAGVSDAKRAYILHSLKRPEEIQLLRSVYGPSAFFIAAYAPRVYRVERLAMQLAEREHHNRADEHRARAEMLVHRDANEAGEFGQDVRKTYQHGDLFLDSSQVSKTITAVERFVALIFGDPWRTPSKEEQGMAFAFLASVRSASPARQVGAALIDEKGNLVSIGVNEAASPNGGQYWEGDQGDGRDFKIGRRDLSDVMRQNVLADIVEKLQTLGLFKEDVSPSGILDSSGQAYKTLRGAQLFDTIDFVRTVHAEASAILAAPGRTKGTTLLVTTFPCHECARHIVAAGIKRVFYVEPYPKSLVNELYKDSIAIDQNCPGDGRVEFLPFTGIAPSVYQHLFQLTGDGRKDKHGNLKVWNASQASPSLHLSYSELAVDAAEGDVLAQLEQDLRSKGIAYESETVSATS